VKYSDDLGLLAVGVMVKVTCRGPALRGAEVVEEEAVEVDIVDVEEVVRLAVEVVVVEELEVDVEPDHIVVPSYINGVFPPTTNAAGVMPEFCRFPAAPQQE
jgi:hypothetical protein